MSHPRFWGWATFAGLLLAPGPARAHGATYEFDSPDRDWALGPAASYVHGPRSGWAINFDTAYCDGNAAGSLNLKFLHEPGYTLYGAQAELSVWFIANWGGGAGYLLGTEHGPVFHLFTGFPFGDGHAFLEPYYRLNFFVPDGLELIHEVGLMIKHTTFTI